MPVDSIQCPNSLVAFFPASVYRLCGTSTVLTGLLYSVDRDKLSAVQFLRNGAVRLTFKSTEDCESAVSNGIQYGDTPLRVVAMEPKSRLVYLRDCPVEVPDSAVSGFFSSYGEIHSITHSKHQGLPGLRDGTRVVKMTLTKDIPGSVRVAGFDCHVWYRRQPPSCAICKKLGHHSKACCLNGLCRRCFCPGHVARECHNAWGRPAASSVLEAVPSASDLATPAEPPLPEDDPEDTDFNPDAEFESEDSSEMEPEFLSGDERVVVAASNPSRSPRGLKKRKRKCRRAGPDDMDVNEEYPNTCFSVRFAKCGPMISLGRRLGQTSSALGAHVSCPVRSPLPRLCRLPCLPYRLPSLRTSPLSQPWSLILKKSLSPCSPRSSLSPSPHLSVHLCLHLTLCFLPLLCLTNLHRPNPWSRLEGLPRWSPFHLSSLHCLVPLSVASIARLWRVMWTLAVLVTTSVWTVRPSN